MHEIKIKSLNKLDKKKIKTLTKNTWNKVKALNKLKK